jgi:glutathione reductase (NADPH)
MVMAAEYGMAVEDARAFGWEVRKAAHHWSELMAAKNREVSRLNGIYKILLDQAGAQIFETRATLVDAHTIALGETQVTAERIVIATGGHPVRAACTGSEHAIVSDDAFYLKEFPRRVAIVGGGYIAVEFAGIFAGLGAETHLIYRQPLPLRGFDEDLRIGLADAMAKLGIQLHPDTVLKSITSQEEGKTVTLSDLQVLNVDLVFAALGRLPNTAGLGLEAAGVRLGEKGEVLVDDALTSSVPHIFALGDVTDVLNLTPVATAEGHALADSLFGNMPRKISLENVPTAVFSIPPIATVGLTEEEAGKRGQAKIFMSKFTPMRHTITGRKRQTIMKLVVDARTDKVIGAHMLGEDAPEIMQAIGVAITAGATKAEFDRTIGIHPTAAEEFVTLRTQTRITG